MNPKPMINILQNEALNGHHKNVKFMCADVTSPDLNFTEGSLDVIFSNWLLMYLSDKEVKFLSSLSCCQLHFLFSVKILLWPQIYRDIPEFQSYLLPYDD